MVQHVSRVNPNGTGLEFVCGLDCPVDVLREDGSSKTVDGVVGLTEDILIILELDDDTDGTEDLFFHDLHVWACVGEDGRLDEVTFVAVTLAAIVERRTFFLARFDVAHDTLSDEEHWHKV